MFWVTCGVRCEREEEERWPIRQRGGDSTGAVVLGEQEEATDQGQFPKQAEWRSWGDQVVALNFKSDCCCVGPRGGASRERSRPRTA